MGGKGGGGGQPVFRPLNQGSDGDGGRLEPRGRSDGGGQSAQASRGQPARHGQVPMRSARGRTNAPPNRPLQFSAPPRDPGPVPYRGGFGPSRAAANVSRYRPGMETMLITGKDTAQVITDPGRKSGRLQASGRRGSLTDFWGGGSGGGDTLLGGIDDGTLNEIDTWL